MNQDPNEYYTNLFYNNPWTAYYNSLYASYGAAVPLQPQPQADNSTFYPQPQTTPLAEVNGLSHSRQTENPGMTERYVLECDMLSNQLLEANQKNQSANKRIKALENQLKEKNSTHKEEIFRVKRQATADTQRDIDEIVYLKRELEDYRLERTAARDREDRLKADLDNSSNWYEKQRIAHEMEKESWSRELKHVKEKTNDLEKKLASFDQLKKDHDTLKVELDNANERYKKLEEEHRSCRVDPMPQQTHVDGQNERLIAGLKKLGQVKQQLEAVEQDNNLRKEQSTSRPPSRQPSLPPIGEREPLKIPLIRSLSTSTTDTLKTGAPLHIPAPPYQAAPEPKISIRSPSPSPATTVATLPSASARRSSMTETTRLQMQLASLKEELTFSQRMHTKLTADIARMQEDSIKLQTDYEARIRSMDNSLQIVKREKRKVEDDFFEEREGKRRAREDLRLIREDYEKEKDRRVDAEKDLDWEVRETKRLEELLIEKNKEIDREVERRRKAEGEQMRVSSTQQDLDAWKDQALKEREIQLDALQALETKAESWKEALVAMHGLVSKALGEDLLVGVVSDGCELLENGTPVPS